MQAKWWAVMLLACAACGVNSDDVDTDDIRAEITVTATETGETKVHAVLLSGQTQVVIGDYDALFAEASGQHILFRQTDSLDYDATLAHLEPGAQVRVRLHREHYSDAAATATIPSAFQIDAPTADQIFPLGADLSLLWSGGTSGNESVFGYSGTCNAGDISGEVHLSRDDGAASLPVVVKRPSAAAPKECTLDVNVQRGLRGQLSGKWSGFIEALQRRSVRVFMK